MNGADGGRAAELRGRLQTMADDGGFNAAFVLLDVGGRDGLVPRVVQVVRQGAAQHGLVVDDEHSGGFAVEPGQFGRVRAGRRQWHGRYPPCF